MYMLITSVGSSLFPLSLLDNVFLILYQVDPQGVECQVICSQLPESAVSEIFWAWESLSTVTCCRSLVIVYECQCIVQIGVAAKSLNDGEALAVDAAKLMQGSLCQGVLKSGAQSYLANLSLYPGRSELPFLPSNTQAVILQPLGDSGIAILGGDTIRGFTTSDQVLQFSVMTIIQSLVVLCFLIMQFYALCHSSFLVIQCFHSDVQNKDL
ncbi:hypothetical protein PTKIN_Ptkin17bG0073200 [Pterospermum kingtungense]